MVRRVTAIAQCDEVGGVIGAASGTGNQVVNVGFAPDACFPACPARMRIAREDQCASSVPLRGLRLGG
jgi:hypothetical protein